MHEIPDGIIDAFVEKIIVYYEGFENSHISLLNQIMNKRKNMTLQVCSDRYLLRI